MQKYIFVLLTSLLFSCDRKDYQRNPFLQEAKFTTTLNLRLAEYNKLRIPGGVVMVDNVGLRGIVVANIGNNYMAWERACPSPVRGKHLSYAQLSGSQARRCFNNIQLDAL